MLRENNKLSNLLLFIFILVFLTITFKGLTTIQPGDENVYYYMGKLVSEGKVPYRDFFYAHPPLHIYLIALIYKIFGFKIIIFKSIPLILTLITAIFIFKIAQEKFGNYEAIFSSLIFLFSYSIMFNSVFSFGIEFATMFLVIGIYFIINQNNYYLAGTFFGFASVTRLLSLVPIFVIIVLILFSNKKNFIKLSSTFLIIFLLVNGIFTLFFGYSYLTPVYKYHLLKSFGSRENFEEYTGILKLNWILFTSALLLFFAKDKKSIYIFAIPSVIYLIFLITLKKIFGFYFLIVFPFLAIMIGYSIVNIYKRINIGKKLKIVVSIILLLIFFWNLASDVLFLEKIGFTGFERGRDLVEFINLNSGKNTLLFGDDSVVPLLALLTNKKIAMDFIDTNNEVFLSGLGDINNILEKLKGEDILFVVRSRQGISYFNEVKKFLNNNCDLLSQFHDRIEGNYLVYRCS